MRDGGTGALPPKVIALMLMLLPSLGLCLTPANAGSTWRWLLMGLVAAGMLVAAATP